MWSADVGAVAAGFEQVSFVRAGVGLLYDVVLRVACVGAEVRGVGGVGRELAGG